MPFGVGLKPSNILLPIAFAVLSKQQGVFLKGGYNALLVKLYLMFFQVVGFLLV